VNEAASPLSTGLGILAPLAASLALRMESDTGAHHLHGCRSSRKAGANRCWFESGLGAAAHGGLGIGEGVCMLAEFLDVDDLAVLD
jgi:hypothetical protein